MNKGFDKATFKRSVIDNVKNMFRRTIDEATPQQVFQAVAFAVKEDVYKRQMGISLPWDLSHHNTYRNHWIKEQMDQFRNGGIQRCMTKSPQT